MQEVVLSCMGLALQLLRHWGICVFLIVHMRSAKVEHLHFVVDQLALWDLLTYRDKRFASTVYLLFQITWMFRFAFSADYSLQILLYCILVFRGDKAWKFIGVFSAVYDLRRWVVGHFTEKSHPHTKLWCQTCCKIWLVYAFTLWSKCLGLVNRFVLIWCLQLSTTHHSELHVYQWRQCHGFSRYVYRSKLE